MDAKNYAALYALQDKALEVLFEESFGFYLSGGTALSRFYLGHRYSDDLDIFTHDVGVFPDTFRLVYGKLRKRWPDMYLEVDGRDFKRVMLVEDYTKLKLDFVSDRVPRVGIPVRKGNIYVDTIRNILSNKISAIMGRDESRDLADLIYISRKRQYLWADLVAEAEEKEAFELVDFLFRLRTFPIESLGSVPFIVAEPLNAYAEDLARIISDLERLGENTVAEKDSITL